MHSDHLVKDVVAQLLDLEEESLEMDRPLAAIPDWDSVNALRVLVYLERELGTALDYDRFMHAQALADLSALVADTAATRSGPRG
jgi:acyl carrier protein